MNAPYILGYRDGPDSAHIHTINRNFAELDKLVEDFRYTLELYRTVYPQIPYDDGHDAPFPRYAMQGHSGPLTPEMVKGMHDDYMAADQKYEETRLARREHNDKRSSWLRMIVKHGAIISYGVHQVIQSTNILVSKTGKLKAALDYSYRKASGKIFAEAFPNVVEARLAAAHPGELHSNPEESALHSIELAGNGNSMAMTDMMTFEADRAALEATVRGKHVRFELSQETLERLSLAVAYYFQAFASATAAGT